MLSVYPSGQFRPRLPHQEKPHFFQFSESQRTKAIILLFANLNAFKASVALLLVHLSKTEEKTLKT